MTRSLRASKEGFETAKKAFQRTGWTQEYLAGRVGCVRQTVIKFLAGQTIEKRLFEAICTELNLELREIADFELEEEQSSKSLGIDNPMVQAFQENISETIQEQCSPRGVFTEPATITEEQKKTDEERVAYAATGTVAKADIPKVKAILALLQKITGDTSIEIVDIESGSVRLILKGSQESLEQLETLFKLGQLTEVLGIPVEDVQFETIETTKASEHDKYVKQIDKTRLIFTISGNLCLEEIRELKAVFSKSLNDGKEIITDNKSRLISPMILSQEAKNKTIISTSNSIDDDNSSIAIITPKRKLARQQYLKLKNNVKNLFYNGQNTVAEEKNLSIRITRKTVRFGDKVYQFKNISGFGLGETSHKNIISNSLISILFISGFFLPITSANVWGILLVALAIIGILFNNYQPKYYGLKLYVNSGDDIIFVTKDLEGIKKVVSVLYDFMESDSEGSCVINIDERHVSINVRYAEQGWSTSEDDSEAYRKRGSH